MKGHLTYAGSPVDMFNMLDWLRSGETPINPKSDVFISLNFVAWSAVVHHLHTAVPDQIVWAAREAYPNLTSESQDFQWAAREVAYDALAFRYGRDVYVHDLDRAVTSSRPTRQRIMVQSMYHAARHAACRSPKLKLKRLERLRLRGMLLGLAQSEGTAMLEEHQQIIKPMRNGLLALERQISNGPGIVSQSNDLAPFFQLVFRIGMERDPNDFRESTREDVEPTEYEERSYTTLARPAPRTASTLH